MTVMSSLLKQISAKMNFDLYRLNIPHFRSTIVIGIDLVMSGTILLIGCSATSNKNLS
jgi:hypothetical protein